MENTGPTESETQSQTDRPAPPVPKGFGLTYVPEYGFNPYECVCITNRPVFSLVYESLFVMNNSFQPEPVLCERFAVSETGTTYLITLCEGVTFSDGSPLTVKDAVASLKAARDSAYYGSRFSRVVDFSVKDERTLEISLEQPYENLPLLLDVPIVKAGTQKEERPIGTGPYAFSEELTGLCLRRNQSWWQENRAPVEYDTILLTAAANPTEVRDSFEFGDTTLVCADLNSPNAVGYRCDYELWDCPTTTLQYLGFNLKSEFFSSRDVRGAVTHIIDRESLIVSVYKGFAKAAYLPCAPDSPLYDQDLAMLYSYDEEAAAAALRTTPVREESAGTLLVCTGDPVRLDMANRLAEIMSLAGLPMEVVAVDAETYRSRLERGKFDAFLGETRLSGNFDLSEFFRSGGSLCFGGIRSSDMEQLCVQALENSGNCYDLFRGVMENAYFCPLLFKSYAVMANRGVIGILQPAVDCVFHLPGGRSLADASVSYEEMIGGGEAETEPTENTEENNP
ncbi:MAG: ABC transporter substrate-binding protein [Oscillospiraceae bacterium]|nr:ABC transporter substrate-binding protein [Oscillospiraceae bacterium]